MAKRYQDKEWLKREYVEKRRSSTDIAQDCDVTATTILDWVDRHGLEKRTSKETQRPQEDYTDPEWLREEYVSKGRSTHDIAESEGVTAATILKWLRRNEIETRGVSDHLKRNHATFVISHGYEVWQSKPPEAGNNVPESVSVHQLLAIAEGADPHKVFSDGEYHVHHENGCRFDNRPSNIELKRGSEHIREHNENRTRTATGEWV